MINIVDQIQRNVWGDHLYCTPSITFCSQCKFNQSNNWISVLYFNDNISIKFNIYTLLNIILYVKINSYEIQMVELFKLNFEKVIKNVTWIIHLV